MSIVSRILNVSLAALFLSGMAVAEEKETPQFIEGTVRVSAEEFIDLVEKHDNLVVIDARKKSDVAQGFIEGSISMPNTETTPEKLAKHLPSKATPVVFYCNGAKCGRSVKSAKIAIAAGYSKIYWFRGGIQEWEQKGLPMVRP